MKKSKSRVDYFGRLEELRIRLAICAAGVLIAAVASFAFVDCLRDIIIRPGGNLQLIYVQPAEALMANIRIAFIAGFTFAMPLIFTQLVLFVSPALYKNNKVIIPTVFAMFILFSLGVAFAYFTVLPFAISFFLKFAAEDLTPMFTISNYLAFATNFLFAFGFVFQLPLVFLFLGKLNLVSAGFLRRNRKYALLVILTVAALITPPDVFSQLMMAAPLLFLYEIGIILVALTQRKQKQEADKKPEGNGE